MQHYLRHELDYFKLRHSSACFYCQSTSDAYSRSHARANAKPYSHTYAGSSYSYTNSDTQPHPYANTDADTRSAFQHLSAERDAAD